MLQLAAYTPSGSFVCARVVMVNNCVFVYCVVAPVAGPRAFTMQTGSRRVALDSVLDLSHVVLMTEVRLKPLHSTRQHSTRQHNE